MKMTIPNKKTKVMFQGITHSGAAVYVERALVYDTKVVAGVSHEKGVKEVLGVPVFQTAKEAVKATKPDVCVVFSSPARVYEDVKEVAIEKVPLIICTTEHVPVQDALKMKQLCAKYGVAIMGPSSPGILVPGACVAGTMPTHLFTEGDVAILARSSSLSYEAMEQLNTYGLGVSMCVALGTAPVLGMDFVVAAKAALHDPKTKAILMISEAEGIFGFLLAAFYGREKRQKPLFVYTAGKSLPRPRINEMLGSKIFKPSEWIDKKEKALREAGAIVIERPDMIGEIMAAYLKEKK